MYERVTGTCYALGMEKQFARGAELGTTERTGVPNGLFLVLCLSRTAGGLVLGCVFHVYDP